MKKVYQAPTLLKRDALSQVTAVANCAVSNCIGGMQ